MGPLGSIEMHVYNSMVFRCHNYGCTERIPLQGYVGHLKNKCKVKTYKKVLLPRGMSKISRSLTSSATLVADDDDVDLFESDDDELGCPYGDALTKHAYIFNEMFKEKEIGCLSS